MTYAGFLRRAWSVVVVVVVVVVREKWRPHSSRHCVHVHRAFGSSQLLYLCSVADADNGELCTGACCFKTDCKEHGPSTAKYELPIKDCYDSGIDGHVIERWAIRSLAIARSQWSSMSTTN